MLEHFCSEIRPEMKKIDFSTFQSDTSSVGDTDPPRSKRCDACLAAVNSQPIVYLADTVSARRNL